MYGIYGGYFIHFMCAAAVVLTCSQQHVVDVLTGVSLGQIYSTKTKNINIVMDITMTNPQRGLTISFLNFHTICLCGLGLDVLDN